MEVKYWADVIQKAHRTNVIVVSPNILMLAINTIQTVMKDARMREQANLIQREVGLLLKDVGRLTDRVENLRRHFTQADGDVKEIVTSAEKVANRAVRIEKVELPQTDAGSLPPPCTGEVYRLLIEHAERNGALSALDADGPIVRDVLDCGGRPTLIKVNADELGRIYGDPVSTEDEVFEAAETIRALEREGVVEITACATHGIFSGPAIDRIEAFAWIVVESMPIASPHSRPLWAATERMKLKTSSNTSFGSRLCVLLTQE